MLRLVENVGRRLLRSSRDIQKLTQRKYSRLTNNSTNVCLRNNLLFNVPKHSKIYGISVVRYQSTVDSATKETVPNPQQVPAQQTENTIANVNTTEGDKGFISEIPDAPIPPPSEDLTSTVAQALGATGEPTFTSLGLGGYGPIGLSQYFLEWLHVSCDLPWWAAITTLTIIVKVLMIQPAISTARNAAKMQHILPEMVKIQDKMTAARNCGNVEEAAFCGAELQALLKKSGVTVASFSNLFIRIALHLPVFISLREIANLPVESLKTGGLWWFTDLTATDPYYLLPILTSVGLYLVTENAMRTANTNMSPLVRYMMRGVPVITFVFALNFPGAILCYWVLSTFTTVLQNEIMKIPKVKKYLNIPLPPVHQSQAANSVLKKKGFKDAFSESWTNIKISRKVANHLRADEIQFNDAGKGPLRKTYKYNPVTSAAIGKSAKTIAAMKK